MTFLFLDFFLSSSWRRSFGSLCFLLALGGGGATFFVLSCVHCLLWLYCMILLLYE